MFFVFFIISIIIFCKTINYAIYEIKAPPSVPSVEALP